MNHVNEAEASKSFKNGSKRLLEDQHNADKRVRGSGEPTQNQLMNNDTEENGEASSLSSFQESLETMKIVLETMKIVDATKEHDNNEKMQIENEDAIDVSHPNVSLTDDDTSICGRPTEESMSDLCSSPTDDPTKKLEEIVIDIDDDSNSIEEEQCKRKKNKTTRKTCCNFECESRENLENAPAFVLTYYQVNYMKGKPQKVCADCFEAAIRHNEHLAYVLSEHKPLLNLKFPPRMDTVVIQDSDEEDSDEDPQLDDSVLNDIEDKLLEVIDSTQENYDLEYQMEESKTILNNTLDELEAGYKEIDDFFNELQRTIDKRRTELYNDYAPPIQQLPALDILETNVFSSASTDTYKTPTTSQYSPGKRPLCSPAHDATRRSPITGVATKKVTQVQRTVLSGSSAPEVHSREAVEVLEHVEASQQPLLPPMGALQRPRPQIGDMLYVMKHGYYGMWSRAKVLEVIPKGAEGGHSTYKIKFEYRKSNPMKQVNGCQMAYTQPSPVRFPVGTRVIALFRDEWAKECYYAGVIAEPPKSTNKYRYLVFFDDGYAQYVVHDKILLVCESSRNVWEDIHPESRDFVKNYLEQYPERPMVKLQQGQIVKTEWNGKWWIARVVEVDGSLVKMHFDADGRTEWIYRGSTRLGPLFAELAQAAARKNQGTFSRHRGLGIASLKKRNMPYVEYTRTDLEELKAEDAGVNTDGCKQSMVPARAVAKKSTTKRSENVTEKIDFPMGVVDRSQQPGRVEYLQVNTNVAPRKFRPHQCGQACIVGVPYSAKDMRGYNPLVVPLLCGWQRHIGRYRGKRVVLYKAPCGRRLRNMEELHRYLRVTKSLMSVDQFDFDFWVHCFAEFILDNVKIFTNIKDMSYGAENVAVPCVNYVDHSMPDYVNYSTERKPMDGVNLNTDPEFLTGCECTDDCQDREKCSCWQLTIQGTAYGQGSAIDPTVGYVYKRLPEPVMTGIYECNSRCKCSNTCLNRVAQHPLQLRLQVFKTENRGWGIRCLNDIPQGSFICIYAGCLLTEQGANEGGKNYGDEYLAELDYIEVVERLKEGYESDVVEDDDDCSNSVKEDADRPFKAFNPRFNPGQQQKELMVDKDTDPSQATGGRNNDGVPPEPLVRNESELSEEEGETSQDARDSDEDFQLDRRRQQMLTAKAADDGSIRTRLRKRASRGSDDSLEKEKDKESEKNSSDEKDTKKSEVGVKKPPHLGSNDEFPAGSDEEDGEEGGSRCREPSRFSAVAEPKKDVEAKPKHRSVREFFGLEEYCYIMDAKNNGNIGRYLNHSCSPNVFVQNVFVDTHDLRFPWVAFFALTYIRSGTELTWDYNYDVGSVPGKVMHCYCGSTDCRGRLL